MADQHLHAGSSESERWTQLGLQAWVLIKRPRHDGALKFILWSYYPD